jgi:hypothetical protein
MHVKPEEMASAIDDFLRSHGGKLRELHLPLPIYRACTAAANTAKIPLFHKAIIAKMLTASGEVAILVNKENL